MPSSTTTTTRLDGALESSSKAKAAPAITPPAQAMTPPAQAMTPPMTLESAGCIASVQTHGLSHGKTSASAECIASAHLQTLPKELQEALKMIVESLPKNSFHFCFCKDCRIFCEQEWEKHIDSSGPFGCVLIGIANLVGHNDLAHRLISFIDFVDCNDIACWLIGWFRCYDFFCCFEKWTHKMIFSPPFHCIFLPLLFCSLITLL